MVTAVAAYNDEVALAVLGAAQSEGIGVPDELAVIGVDDLHAGRLVVPALTTVVQAVELEASTWRRGCSRNRRHGSAPPVAG